ncbi:MAG TPA: hypothetical protein VM243_07595, partial [Phycisphaerae bacterium]|nr:hypothetical protein [Phycisphaerae bacterium]
IAGKPVSGTVMISGQQVAATQFADQLRRFNFVNSGVLSQAADPNMFAQTKSRLKAAYSKWWIFNNEVESTMKSATFLSFLDDGMDVQQAATKTIQAMPDLTDLSKFEREVGRRVFPWFSWCVPTDHRILTRRGWKEHGELNIGEDVLTYNVEKDCSEWQPVTEIATFWYDGTVLVLGNSKARFTFTPDHRWPVWYRTTHDGMDTGSKRKMVRGYQLKSSHRIPKTAPYRFPTESTLTPRDAAILGWIVTDGHMRLRKGKYVEAVIYQKKERFLSGIRKLLADELSGETPDARSATIMFRLKTPAAKRIYAACPSKSRLPGIVTRLSRKAAEAMWDAMMAAEGSVHERAGTSFTQKAGPVLEAFQILSVLLGRTANTPGPADSGDTKTCYISKERQWMRVAGALTHEHYRGTVWCPVTKNGTWMMEHDGRTIFTGNTRKNAALQLTHFLPNKPAWMAGASKFSHAFETARTGGQTVPGELRPEWMREAQAMQISGDAEQGNVFLLASWLPFQEIIKLFAAASSPQEGMKALVEQMRPGMKFAVEMASGVDMFRRQPLEPMTLAEMVTKAPSAVLGRSGTPLDNLLSVRPLREAARVAWDMPGAATKVQRTLLGGAIQPVSAARGRVGEWLELRERARVLRAQLNRALQVNDNALAQQLATEYTRVMRMMQQAGYPGVPKATSRLLTQHGIPAGEPALER